MVDRAVRRGGAGGPAHAGAFCARAAPCPSDGRRKAAAARGWYGCLARGGLHQAAAVCVSR